MIRGAEVLGEDDPPPELRRAFGDGASGGRLLLGLQRNKPVLIPFVLEAANWPGWFWRDLVKLTHRLGGQRQQLVMPLVNFLVDSAYSDSSPKEQGQQLCQFLSEHRHDVGSGKLAEDMRVCWPPATSRRRLWRHQRRYPQNRNQPKSVCSPSQQPSGRPRPGQSGYRRSWDQRAAQRGDSAKQFRVLEPDKHPKLSAQRETCDRPGAWGGADAIPLADNRKQLVYNNRLEFAKIVVTAALLRALENVRGMHHHDHRHHLALGYEVVDMTSANPPPLVQSFSSPGVPGSSTSVGYPRDPDDL